MPKGASESGGGKHETTACQQGALVSAPSHGYGLSKGKRVNFFYNLSTGLKELN